MELFELVRDSGANNLAIVGMTKNVGKTVTFNYLVQHLHAAGEVLGLLSAGRDGERYCLLTLIDKPSITPPAGSLAATAAACFDAAGALLDMVEDTGIPTAMGDMIIGRVRRAGRLELAGPAGAATLRRLVRRLHELGAGRVLVDGAINRLASAAPGVSDAVILCTGAAVGASMEDVVRKTLFRRAVLETPPVPEGFLRRALEKAAGKAAAVLLHREGSVEPAAPLAVQLLQASIPLMAREKILASLRPETEAVMLAGALEDGLLQGLMEREHLPALVVRDATRIFVTPELYYRYLHRGGRIMALQPVKLLAATVNPTDPGGYGYEPRQFFREMAAALEPLPVYDLVLGTGSVAKSYSV